MPSDSCMTISSSELRFDPRLFAGDQRLGTRLQIRILQALRDGAQGVRHIADPVETAFKPGSAETIF